MSEGRGELLSLSSSENVEKVREEGKRGKEVERRTFEFREKEVFRDWGKFCDFSLEVETVKL